MKKSLLIFIFLLILLPLASSIEIKTKSEFNKGETLFAKISGNFIEPIQKQNIKFYRGHSSTFVEYDIVKIENDFYIYALLDRPSGNYSVVIEQVEYMHGGEFTDENIVINFSITEDVADFSVNPGFISTNKDFSITLQNLQDSGININVKVKTEYGEEKGFFASLFGWLGDEGEDESSLTLKSGEKKTIDFELGELKEPTFKIIEFSTPNLIYEIPIYVLSNKTAQDVKERRLNFNPNNLNVTMAPNSSTIKIIYLYNTGQLSLSDINISVSDSLKPYLSLSLDKIDALEKSENEKIILNFTSDYKERAIEGQITAKSGNLYTYSGIFLNFVENYVPSNDTQGLPKNTCLEMAGQICTEEEECEGEKEYASDGVCCIGKCKKIKSGITGALIGWLLIIVIIVLIVLFFFFKYRKTKLKPDLLNIGKGKK